MVETSFFPVLAVSFTNKVRSWTEKNAKLLNVNKTFKLDLN